MAQSTAEKLPEPFFRSNFTTDLYIWRNQSFDERSFCTGRLLYRKLIGGVIPTCRICDPSIILLQIVMFPLSSLALYLVVNWWVLKYHQDQWPVYIEGKTCRTCAPPQPPLNSVLLIPQHLWNQLQINFFFNLFCFTDRDVAIEFFGSLAGSKLMGAREGIKYDLHKDDKGEDTCGICDGDRLNQVLDTLKR